MDYWAIILALTAVTLAIYYYLFNGLDYFEKRGIPCIKPVPLLGNMNPVFFRKLSIADLILNAYRISPEAKYLGFYDFNKAVIIIKDLELIKSITVKNFESFPNHRAFVDPETDPLFGKNLFSLQGQIWKEWRNLLSPAFTSSKMKMMFKLMYDCADDFADFFKAKAEKEIEKGKTGIALEMKDSFTRYTNDVIATCAFGIGVDSMRNPNNEFYLTGKDVTNFEGIKTLKFFFVRLMPKLCKWLGLKFVGKKSENYFKNTIARAIEARENGVTRSDMIQLMIESKAKGKELTLEEMTAQAMVFFFGGFDTTSTLMCFASHEIAVNTEVQQKLQREIDNIWEISEGHPTYEIINNMEYLGAVLNETLRIYPAVVFLDRVASSNFELPPALPGLEPYQIKKGDTVWLPAYGLHHDPNYYEQPNKFIPERFLGDRKNDIDQFAYLPFGVGPRMCIGNRFALLETKVLMFCLLSKCQLEPCEKTEIPMKLSKKGLIMRPENGFWLNLKPRDNPPNVRGSKVDAASR